MRILVPVALFLISFTTLAQSVQSGGLISQFELRRCLQKNCYLIHSASAQISSFSDLVFLKEGVLVYRDKTLSISNVALKMHEDFVTGRLSGGDEFLLDEKGLTLISTTGAVKPVSRSHVK